MLSLMTLPVMPEKFWKTINSATRYPPHRWPAARIASPPGAWASTLPTRGLRTTGPPTCVNSGRWNFDTLRYDYYLDDNVAFEAFKAGAVDRREENVAKNWLPATSGAILPTAISLKMNTPTPRRRIRSGWPLTFSARYFQTAGYAKPLPSPLILNG